MVNLAAEIVEVMGAFGGQQVYLPDAATWGVQLQHRSRWIVAHHAPDHPFSPSWVFLDPEPRHAHYYIHSGESHARLCFCAPSEWSPSYHLIVAVGAAMRFINEEL